VLANSDIGAMPLGVYCDDKLHDGASRYVFTDFDRLTNIVTRGMRVGFALPLQSDHFRVVRFDLRGSRRAVSEMRSTFKAKEKERQKSAQPGPTGTRDQVL